MSRSLQHGRQQSSTLVSWSHPAGALKRHALLHSTALQAVVVVGVVVSSGAVADAQTVPAALSARAAGLSPTALPTGGQVAAGSATVNQNGSTLAVQQSTASAGINWRSFDIGTQGTVSFTAPSPQSVTINRVVGPDPSVIAGKLTANDKLVLINQSGVLFTKGAQVDTQSLVVSAAGITDANLKAGKLVLDQAPNAGGRGGQSRQYHRQADRAGRPGGTPGGQFRRHQRQIRPCRAGRRRGRDG